MAKGKMRTMYVCQQCGSESMKWQGRCNDCGEYNTFVEISVPAGNGTTSTTASRSNFGTVTSAQPQSVTTITTDNFQRITVPFTEFNRVLGGGLVPGSLVLIGGDPGIGKSTLLLQISTMLTGQAGKVLYVSAEESVQQIKMRAERLSLNPPDLYLYSEVNLDTIIGAINDMQPGVVVIDSIQTVYLPEYESTAGSVSQVRGCASRLMELAKGRGIPIFIVGHVTKEGAIAGPRVLEHMVDAVLYLEGDRFHQYRLLRGVKNRFGSINEVGIFEMTSDGMIEVTNPSQAFLAERALDSAGSAVAVTMEGTRPILVEVQALCSTTAFGLPRRTANGIDLNRLNMIVAVLSKRVGLSLFNQDIYVNIVGGLKITETAADLAVAMAITSSFRDRVVDPELVVVGEIGLSGELRTVSQLERRLGEAAKLGFKKGLYPMTARPPELARSFLATGVAGLEQALEIGIFEGKAAGSEAIIEY